MEIKILNKTKEQVQFLVKDINFAIANTLRRLVVDEVPCLAIEDVEVKKNTSALYDEMLAHRLGLIPLKTDLKSYTFHEECKCKGKGCALCQLHITLKAKGPCTVYASDFKIKDPKVKPVFEKTPIVKLLEKQEIELSATAILGKGKEHIKFSPGLIFYKAYPQIKITNAKKEAAEVCPTGAIYLENNKLKTDELKCILCNACVEHGAEVNPSETDFIITIEPFGQLTPKEMVLTAFDILNDKLKEFNKLISKIK